MVWLLFIFKFIHCLEKKWTKDRYYASEGQCAFCIINIPFLFLNVMSSSIFTWTTMIVRLCDYEKLTKTKKKYSLTIILMDDKSVSFFFQWIYLFYNDEAVTSKQWIYIYINVSHWEKRHSENKICVDLIFICWTYPMRYYFSFSRKDVRIRHMRLERYI
jgi:hypothetical protein